MPSTSRCRQASGADFSWSRGCWPVAPEGLGIEVPIIDALSASTSEFGGDYFDDYISSALSAAHNAIFSTSSITFAVGEGLEPVSARDEAFATTDGAFDEVDKRLGEVDHEDHWLGDAHRASEGLDGGSLRRAWLARQAV
jgi:hypothetical protein